MISPFINLWLSFLAGLFAPIGAVCVLPLYPAFLSYLSKQLDGKSKIKNKPVFLGWVITAGVIFSLFLIGLIFNKILKVALTNVIAIISPIAFGILGIISLFMIFNVDFSRIFPRARNPTAKNPILNSFLFGMFFGVIVLPCNPASLVILFSLSFSTADVGINLLSFILFGIGMATPLLLFAYITNKAQGVITFLTRNKRKINLIAGLIMLVVSLYYLIFVFRIFQ